MKKVLLGLLVLASITANAQKDKTLMKAIDAKDYVKAKAEVDALIAKEETKPDYWYWKHKILFNIGIDEKLSATEPTALEQGLEAYKKYVSLDKKMTRQLLDGIADASTIFSDYRSAHVTRGSKLLDEKKFAEASTSLGKAVDIFDDMARRKMVNYALDTSITFYTGYAAANAKDNVNAEKYYKKIVDAKAICTDCHIAYGWMANYYLNEKKDATTGKAILKTGLELFPTNEYLVSLNNNEVNNSGDYTTMFANDEANIAKPNAEFQDFIIYTAHLFDYVVTNKTAADRAARTTKLEEMLTKIITMKPNSTEANYLNGLHKFNTTIAIDDKIKALKGKATPADNANRDKLRAERTAAVDAGIKYLDLTASILRSKGAKRKPEETVRLKDAYTRLIDLYNYKNDTQRVASLKEDLKELGN